MAIVRLKPHDPRQGHRLRSLIDGARDGKRYNEGALYEVSASEAEHLSWFMQDGDRVDPKTVVHGLARAFDVFADREAARAVLEEEGRGALLLPSSAQILLAPGRDAPDKPIPAPARETEIQADLPDGSRRTLKGPAQAPQPSGPEPADNETFFDPAPKNARPPTAQERRDAAIQRQKARAAGRG